MTERNDGFASAETFEGYEVYDRDGDKIGKVEDLFVDERDKPEYLGVKMGLFGLSGTTLVPWELCRRDESEDRIEVQAEKERVKDAPSFDDDEGITPEYERQIHDHYGLQGGDDLESRGSYGSYYSDDDNDRDYDDEGKAGPGMRMGDTDSGKFEEHPPEEEGVDQPGSDLEDEDELRVQRTEEELRAGTREREAGKVNVRKRVRTDREEVRVPKKREEVTVDRVEVNEEASDAEIGEDEIRVPVVEEEVVAEKKPVVKEEVRVQKDVVEDEEVIEEDLRKEEVEVEDETERGGRRD